VLTTYAFEQRFCMQACWFAQCYACIRVDQDTPFWVMVFLTAEVSFMSSTTFNLPTLKPYSHPSKSAKPEEEEAGVAAATKP